MSYTPLTNVESTLTDINTELGSLNTEQDNQSVYQKHIRTILENILEQQIETNKLLNKIYNPE